MEENSRMFRRIYGYCERGFLPGGDADAFWAEPLNAVTNAAFIIAAAVALTLAIRARRLDGPNAWLILLTFIVGIGSFLFHTYAMVWAAIMDSTPILIFILSYFTIAMNRFGGFGWGKSIALVVGFLATLLATSYFLREGLGAFAPPLTAGSDAFAYLYKLTLVVGVAVLAMAAWVFILRQLVGLPWAAALVWGAAYYAGVILLSEAMTLFADELFRGARSYLPALFALFAIGLWLRSKRHPAGMWLIAVAGVFTISLTFRALDRPLCALYLTGTHWLWHVLNGVVLGTLIVAVIRHGRTDASPETTRS